MRYIVCEDNRSGFYFWFLIKQMILKKFYMLVDVKMMNEIMHPQISSNTIGIANVKKYLETLINGNNKDLLQNNTFIVCIDSAVDNKEVANDIQSIQMIAGMYDNIHIINYICFEQLLFASDNELRFFPMLNNSKEYKIIKQHIHQYGLGHARELKMLLDSQNISYKTTETVFSKLIERSVIYQKSKIGNIYYNRMVHHYIYKGKWSECWTTDCTINCPNDKCWEATTNNLKCNNCKSPLRGKTQTCININSSVIRKYAEETSCSRNLPPKLKERIKLLFNIPEILKIDNY